MQPNLDTITEHASPPVAVSAPGISSCCWAPKRLRVHHVLDDYGAQAKIVTRRWVICGECGEAQ